MVILITGIIVTAVAVFIRAPVQAYLDTTRRAELADEADTLLRRMTRDLRLALPNSVRVVTIGASDRYVEFLLTSGGGRYRAEVTAAGTGNILNFGAADSSFDVIGPVPAFAGGESIVVYNLGPGFAPADAYAAANNRAAFASVAGSTVTLTAPKLFPFESPGKRFQVVQYPVTYGCVPNAANPAAGTITRYWGYGFNAAQVAPPSGGSSAIIAANVSNCAFSYDPNVLALSNGLVTLSVSLTKGGETVTLFQEAHVSNVP